ncbi:MAG TPA: PfkB family carbohydrate kinase [Acidimicrobiia bacterium]
MTRLAVVGSINVDFVWHGSRLPATGETVGDGELVRSFGGKGANQAAAAARLGADVTFVGAVGDDDLGAAARADLAASGVDCSALVVMPACATGVALINVADTGENTITVAPGANHRVEVDAIRLVLQLPASRPDVLLTGYEIGSARAAGALEAARTFGIATICNPSPAETGLPSSHVAIENSDVVIVNDLEADAYGGPGALLGLGAQSVVVTHGRSGASCFDASGVVRADGFDIDAVDSTGAGDAFCAAFALRRDLVFACAAGALACRALGARAAQPTVAEIEALLREQPRSRP